MRERPIVIASSDASRLRGLLSVRGEASARDQEHLHELKSELERALVLERAEVPFDVVTMYTRVRVLWLPPQMALIEC